MIQGQARNLLILHTPVAQALSDWEEVKERIEARAPDIDVRIANNLARNFVTRRWQTSRPSLVFSPLSLKEYQPPGGKVYTGRPLDKLEQVRRLRQVSLPTPETVPLTPDLKLPLDKWGEYVVTKPINSGVGKGVRLVRTFDLARRYAELTNSGQTRTLVQPRIEHIDMDGRACEYRVSTLFGRELFAVKWFSEQQRRPLEEIAADPAGKFAQNTLGAPVSRELSHDEEVTALARRAHQAFPEIPCLGVDILRETRTGRLFILEVNPYGNTWHLSSEHALTTFAPEFRRNLYAQFDALNRTAELLIEKTRTEAV